MILPVFIFIIVGFIAQFIDGTLGMAFGVISSSFLISIGIAPALASASIHTAEIGTTLISGMSHLKFGNVKREWVWYLVIPGMIGGCLGALFISNIPGGLMKPWVASLLLFLGILILFRFTTNKRIVLGGKTRSNIKFIGVGLVAAFFDAIGGGGWGPIATPGLIITENENPRDVIGTVNFCEFFVTVSEAITFVIVLGAGSYDWKMIAMLFLGGAICAPFAAFALKKIPTRITGILVGALVVAYNARTLLLLL